MAMSSIIDNIVIRDPKQVEAFADAVEKAFQNPLGRRRTSVRMVRDKAEFIQLMEKMETAAWIECHQRSNLFVLI